MNTYSPKDVVKIGKATLYLGDCYLMLEEIAKQADGLVMDPPYLFNASGGGKFRKARPLLNQAIDENLTKGFDHNTFGGGKFESCVVFCHNDQLPDLLPWVRQEWSRFALLEWHKKAPAPMANKHYVSDTEFYIHSWNKGHHPLGTIKDLARYHIEGSARSLRKITGHPTVKPHELMMKIVTNMNASVILDPFMGTGSTGVACRNQGKAFIGIEENPKHFATAIRRLRGEL